MKHAPVSKTEARYLAHRCVELLREQFGAQRVVVFGSVAGDAPWHRRSDLDLAVEGIRPEDFWRAVSACSDLLPPDLELDLIPIEAAWPELQARIEGETPLPENPKEALTIEINNELRHLEIVVQELVEFIGNISETPHKIQVEGMGTHLHDFYNGVERIIERITVRVDGDLPDGRNWHTLLLQRMAQPFSTRRPEVIDHGLEEDLAEYLRFRHLFRHTYGYDLRWERIRALSGSLPAILANLEAQLLEFLDKLPDDATE